MAKALSQPYMINPPKIIGTIYAPRPTAVPANIPIKLGTRIMIMTINKKTIMKYFSSFWMLSSCSFLRETSPASFQIIISKLDRRLFCFKISPFHQSFNLTTTTIIDVQSIDFLASIENKQFLVLINSIFSLQADIPPLHLSEPRQHNNRKC